MPSRERIEKMFDRISPRYDLLNDLLSLKIHWIWKNKLVSMILNTSPNSVLDVATGTGDIASLIKHKNTAVNVVGADISEGMLSVARERFSDIEFVNDDITNSNFDDNTYDSSVISFGIRNVSEIDKALVELARISKDFVYILEFGQPRNMLINKIYFFIMKIVMSLVGTVFGQKSSYEYLIESSSKFPSDEKFVSICKSNKLGEVEVIPLFFGVCYIYKISLN